MSLKKTDLIAAVAAHTGSTSKDVAAVLSGIEDVVVANVAKGEKVVITGFLTFDRAQRAARTGRNPQTGEAIKIKASKSPRVSAGASFKKVVNGRAPSPKLVRVEAGRSAWERAAHDTSAHPSTSTANDNAMVLVTAFRSRLAEGASEIDSLDPNDAELIGLNAANVALASARWSQVLGDRIDTTQASELLGISRQALYKRQSAGSILGLPGQGTTWFPSWQFDMLSRSIRSEVSDIIGAFRERLDAVDPFTIAAWAVQKQEEDLEGIAPADWIGNGGDRRIVRVAAERAASRLAQ